MKTKKITALGMALTAVATILIFTRLAHSHKQNTGVTISQNAGKTAAASAPLDSASTSPAAGTALSSLSNTDVAAANTPATEAAQSQVPLGETQSAATVAAAVPAAAVTVHPETRVYATAVPVAGIAVAKPIVVPAGTTLIVRLAEPLGSRISEEGQSFSAALDRDVLVDGQKIIPAGAGVMGKITYARPIGVLAGEPTLQLRLTALNVNNTDLPVVTSTRSFGSRIKGKNKVGRLMKGLFKRAVGDEREVILDDQTAYSFTLGQPLQIW